MSKEIPEKTDWVQINTREIRMSAIRQTNTQMMAPCEDRPRWLLSQTTGLRRVKRFYLDI